MRLIIAEKPSLARTIAEALGQGQRRDGHIKGRDWIITWAFGHMYEQAMPDEYLSNTNTPATTPSSLEKKASKDHSKKTKKQPWRKEDLPIIPQQWILHSRPDVKAQLKIITQQLKKATLVIHAGDPDREGQLLVDEILVESKWSGPTKRIWLQDLTREGIKRSFQSLKSNTEYKGLYQAALSRSRCDWLLGMNVTRAYTLAYQQAGGHGVISVGRVQTPTLNLIVERNLLIENFVPVSYYTVAAEFKHEKGLIPTDWIPKIEDCDPKIDDKHCLNPQIAQAVADKIKNQQGHIKSSRRTKRKEKPPLPFSLSALQTAASAKWGYGAQQTLDAAQQLYESHKLITYPRTDVGYLSENQRADVKKILSALGKANPILVEGTDSSRKSRAFNDKKVTAHTGIIPTAKIPNIKLLTKTERSLYGLIARHYVAQFLPDHEYQNIEIKIECVNELFIGKGRITLIEGWKSILPPSRKEAGDLPLVTNGDKVHCLDSKVIDKKTKPSSQFTEGTLIKAMAGIARYVEDKKVKAALKESAGIGTEATRASIIETLKTRHYIDVKGKQLISTSHGRHFIRSIPSRVKDPAVTAWWEQQLSEIANEGADAEAFMQKITHWMTKLVTHAAPEQFKQAAEANPRKTDGNHPPTKKMIALAKKLAHQKKIKPPRGYTQSFDLTRQFIDQYLTR